MWIGKYNLNLPGPGGINLSGPYQWGPAYDNFVLFRATASSPQCAAGIAAMRVYISPGVWANTERCGVLAGGKDPPEPAWAGYPNSSCYCLQRYHLGWLLI